MIITFVLTSFFIPQFHSLKAGNSIIDQQGFHKQNFVSLHEQSRTSGDQLNWVLENPAEEKRTYSDANGTGLLTSMLGSGSGGKAWTLGPLGLPAQGVATHWTKLDLGTVKSVVAVVTQGRDWEVDPLWGSNWPYWHPGERVTSYKVKVSINGLDWTDVDNGIPYNSSVDVDSVYSDEQKQTDLEVVRSADKWVQASFAENHGLGVKARYVQVWPLTWSNGLSMRWGVKVLAAGILENPDESAREYSSEGRGHLDSETFSSMLTIASAPYPSWWRPEWSKLDLGMTKLVVSVVTQGRWYIGNRHGKDLLIYNSGPYYEVQTSLDGLDWTKANESEQNPVFQNNLVTYDKHMVGIPPDTMVEGQFQERVAARYVRLHVGTIQGRSVAHWYWYPCLRWGVTTLADSHVSCGANCNFFVGGPDDSTPQCVCNFV